jgi:hypothetical protein
MSEIAEPLRTRVLEVLALVADEDAQRRYQAAVPHVDVPAELFNQWEESFFPRDCQFQSAFADEELDALRRFDVIMREVSAKTPRQLPALDVFITTDAWRELSMAARVALGEVRR